MVSTQEAAPRNPRYPAVLSAILPISGLAMGCVMTEGVFPRPPEHRRPANWHTANDPPRRNKTAAQPPRVPRCHAPFILFLLPKYQDSILSNIVPKRKRGTFPPFKLSEYSDQDYGQAAAVTLPAIDARFGLAVGSTN